MQFDIFKAEPTFRHKHKAKSGSISLGIISMIILGVFLYLLVSRINSAINFTKDDIKYSTKQINNQYYYPKYDMGMSPFLNNFIFAVFIQTDLKDYQYQIWQYAIHPYGQYWNQQTSNMERIQLQNCQAQKWKILGQNYQEIFNKQRLGQAYCSKSPFNISTKNFNQNLFRIIIAKCKVELHYYCEQITYYVKQNNFIDITVKLFSKTDILNIQNPVLKQIKTRLPVSKNSSDDKNPLYIQYKNVVNQIVNKIKVVNKPSIFSFYNQYSQQVTQGFTVGDYQSRILKRSRVQEGGNMTDYDDYLQINLKIGEETLIYIHQNQKIDHILSFVGGLFEIVMVFLIFFFIGYNKRKYELTVAGSFFNFNNDGLKFQRKDLNFWTYYKHSAYRWAKYLCGIPIKKASIKIMDQTFEEASKILDVKNLYKKLTYLEQAVQSTQDKNMLKVLAITRKNNFQQLRSQRVLLSYYQNVIKLFQAATVQDALATRAESFAYLSKKTIEEDIEEIQKLGNPSFKNNLNSSQMKGSDYLKQSLMKDLGLQENISQCISYYPILAQKARKVELDPVDQEMEYNITQSFLQLDSKAKNEIIMKIPIIILHRLRMKAVFLNKQSSLLLSSRGQNKRENFIQKDQFKTIKKRIRKSLKEFLCFFDLFKADPLLRSDQRSEKSNVWFGFINFLVIIVLVIIFAFHIQKFVNYDGSKLTIDYYQDVYTGQKEIKNFMMAFKLPKSKQYFKNNHLNLYRYFVFLVQYHQSNSSDSIQYFSTSIVPCRSLSWKLLGDDSQNYFKGQNLNETYCLKEPLNFTVNQNKKQFFSFSFMSCYNYDSPLCSDQFKKYWEQMQQQYQGVPFDLIYLTPSIQLNKPDAFVYHTKRVRFFIPKQKSAQYKQYYSTYKVITDKSVWSYTSDIQEVKNSLPDYMHPNMFLKPQKYYNSVQFQFTNKLYVTTRKRTQILYLFSFIGGLLSFIFVFSNIFFKKYNQICYQLKISENLFRHNSKGKDFNEQNFKFLAFLRYMIFYFIKTIFYVKLNWKKIRQFDKNLQLTNQFMQAENIVNRIGFLEKAIRQNTDSSLYMCLSLIEHLSIADVRKNIKTLDYYDTIIKSNQAATVQEAEIGDPNSFLYLKDFKVTKTTRNQKPMKLKYADESLEVLQQNFQQSLKQQIYLTLIEDLHLQEKISSIVSIYPVIALQASQIQLNSEQRYIENEITLAFLALDQEKKSKVAMKMPIIILHRLRIRAIELKNVSKEILDNRNESQDQVSSHFEQQLN